MILGVIGGSGLYQLSDAELEPERLQTPYGDPSGPYFRETVGEHTLIFLARHGAGHSISPSEINYRANVYGFKQLGAQCLVSISAVGSMREEIAPGDFVLPDQYLDFTRGLRPNTFFGGGVVAHALFADPACASLRDHLAGIAGAQGVKVHSGGTYVCIEGPQFSTRAESRMYRSIEGVAVIGMTALPEARLAREAGLCYQTVAMATDYDCWNEVHGDVSVDAILKVLHANVSTSRRLVKSLASQAFPSCRSGCRALMKNAVITPRESWPSARRAALEVVLR